MKIKKKIGRWGGGGGIGSGNGLGVLGGCERRIEVFCENSKNKFRGGSGRGRVGGVRVDVNETYVVLPR